MASNAPAAAATTNTLSTEHERLAFWKECLASPPNTPAASPPLKFGKLVLRVPTDNAARDDLIKEAHRACAGREDYVSAMRHRVAHLLETQPIFWARVWPAGLCLAHWLLSDGGRQLVARRAVLELGTGLGPGAIAAALAGATRVVATDIEAKALMFVAASAHDNGVQRSVRTAAWDWNDSPPAKLDAPYDVVLAGDVLYQDEHAREISARLDQLLKPGGIVVFSDSLERPYRDAHRSDLRSRLESAGYELRGCRDMDVRDVDFEARTGLAAGDRAQMLLFSRPFAAPPRRP